MMKVWLVLVVLSVVLINSCSNDKPDMVTNTNGAQPQAAISTSTGANNAPGRASTDPVARFKVDLTTGNLTTVFTLDGTASTGNDIGRTWDFADGTVIQGGKIVTHKFKNVGAYNVRLRVKDSAGKIDYASRKITVLEDTPPTAKFSVDPTSGGVGTKFHFDASESSDLEGSIASYKWDFGDGSKGQGKGVDHSFQKEGTYPVALTVKDHKGQSGTDTVNVKVEANTGACNGALMPAFAENTSCGGFVGQLVCVASISGNVMITSPAVVRCPGKCGEFRRDHGVGLHEFAGSIARLDGTRVILDYGSLPASSHPRAGEVLRAIWLGQCR